jgi:hypothetical protein
LEAAWLLVYHAIVLGALDFATVGILSDTRLGLTRGRLSGGRLLEVHLPACDLDLAAYTSLRLGTEGLGNLNTGHLMNLGALEISGFELARKPHPLWRLVLTYPDPRGVYNASLSNSDPLLERTDS